MWQTWINQISEQLVEKDNVQMNMIWNKNRMLFDNALNAADSIDYQNAKLILATLKRKTSLLISLPDKEIHRSSFLIATALVESFLKARLNNISINLNPVLYFGTHVGIREQLSYTSIQGLGVNFSEIFSQQDIKRGQQSITVDKLYVGNLPRIITVYSPADPAKIISDLNPPWIAIDCSDIKSPPWFPIVLKEAKNRNIPVIAWSQNPLSNCISVFKEYGEIFVWPLNTLAFGEMNELISIYDEISITAQVGESSLISRISEGFRLARKQMSITLRDYNNKIRLEHDALTAHWRYLYALETLCVPLDFYEMESSKYWGLQPIESHKKICREFQSAISNRNLANSLNKLLNIADDLQQLYKEASPLWELCVNYIKNPVKDADQILVFQTDSMKKLFNFALLAKVNITDDILFLKKLSISSIKELCGMNKDNNLCNRGVRPTIVGLPSPGFDYGLLDAFSCLDIDFILYPHLLPTLKHRILSWENRLGFNYTENATTLKILADNDSSIPPFSVNKRILFNQPVVLNASGQTTMNVPKPISLLSEIDPVAEIEKLFSFDLAEQDDDYKEILDGQALSTKCELEKRYICSDVIKVLFDDGWYAYFDSSSKINIVIPTGLEERYIKSLSSNQKVLMIHGQRRQNLYELIISRLHEHSSFVTHIAMIRRWQEEVNKSYNLWRREQLPIEEFYDYGERDINNLFKRMKKVGSTRISSQTISNWIDGYVLCPDDPEDLLRISEILNIEFVKKNYQTIFNAANRLRGLHIGLSLKLNSWIRNQLAGIQGKDLYDIIDEELGLRFDDLKNSLLILNVKTIELINEPFLNSSLGIISKEGQ